MKISYEDLLDRLNERLEFLVNCNPANEDLKPEILQDIRNLFKVVNLQSDIFNSDKFIEFYNDCIRMAHENNQVVGKKRDYYLTLEQIEYFLQKLK